MKKLFQIIRLRKLKTELTKDSLKKLEGHEFYVLYRDKTWEWCINKEEIKTILEQDHIKPVKYIFDATDRIIIERNVLINTEI